VVTNRPYIKKGDKMAERILIVEDDADINNLLKNFLEEANFHVTQAFSGSEASFLKSDDFDLLIMDLMLPGKTGEELIKEVRKKTSVPILVISGKSAIDDKLEVFDLGADDYMVKPFEKRELLARVKVLLKRKEAAKDSGNLEHRLLSVNPRTMEVMAGDELLNLTQTEYLILIEMMKEPDVVFSRDKLYEKVWGLDYLESDNAITVHISHLRQKLRKATGEDLISTVWGVGYKFNS